MPKPSVAILHYSCPPVIGGVEFIIEAHARAFVETGYPIRFIVGRGGAGDPGIKTVVIPEIASRGGPNARVLKALASGSVPGRSTGRSRPPRRSSCRPCEGSTCA